jgi:DNA-binding XRE family transcriptional regulator
MNIDLNDLSKDEELLLAEKMYEAEGEIQKQREGADEPTSPIRKARDAEQLTQRDLAAVTGISQPELSYIEQGRMIPKPEQMEAIAVALHARPEDLFPGPWTMDDARKHQRERTDPAHKLRGDD